MSQSIIPLIGSLNTHNAIIIIHHCNNVLSSCNLDEMNASDQEKNPQLFSKEAKSIEEYVEEGEIWGGGGGGGPGRL